MKKILFLIALFVTSAMAVAQDAVISVYLSDNDVTTNIRNKPSGKVAMQITASGDYILNLASPQNGWWKIIDLWEVGDNDREIALQGSSTGSYWIHYSVIGASTRNYGGEQLSLRVQPKENAKAVHSFSEEIQLHPMDIKGDWVKVKVDGTDIVGWIESEWLCGNPLTNCC